LPDVLTLKTQFFENAVNEVGLSEVDCVILKPLYIDYKEVRDISLYCEVKTCIIHVLDNLIQFFHLDQSGWTHLVEHIDALVTCEDTSINLCTDETNGLEHGDTMLVPDCLLVSAHKYSCGF